MGGITLRYALTFDTVFAFNQNYYGRAIINNARMEDIENLQPGNHFQFERKGYFVLDPDTSDELPVFNRTVELRDNWAKKAITS